MGKCLDIWLDACGGCLFNYKQYCSGISTQRKMMLLKIMLLEGLLRHFTDTIREIGDFEDTTRTRTRTRRRRRRVETPDVNVCDSEIVKPDCKRRKVMPLQLAACPIDQDRVSEILGWLRNDEINTISICGMGGIGKTTLAKQVHARLQYSDNSFTDNADQFTAIAWVTVGLHFTVVDLQQKIVEGFGLDLRGDKDVNRRAGLLNALLCSEPKCILFLDDLWQDFRREDVGIPKHCKLVITSRSLDVCRIMRCQKVFKVEPLPDEQAWQLFFHSLGDGRILQDRKEIEDNAKQMCRQCCGVPLAINFLANSMRGAAEVSTWRRALKNLTETSNEIIHVGDIITVLRKSYDNLSSAKVKRCFVLCALHHTGKAMSREELISLWIQQGLIDNVQSQQVQYDMGHSILNKLQNSCLLDATDDNSQVKMHDFIRSMGISISEDHCIM